MKRILIIAFSVLCLVGCGNVKEKVEIKEETEKHVHKYNKEVVTEPSCVAGGVAKFSCECGEYFISAIPAKTHELGEYVYDNNATVYADGTETSTCVLCGEKITKRAVGTKLEHIFNDIAIKMRVIDEFAVQDNSGLHEISLTKGCEVDVDGESEDGMYRFHVDGRTYEALKDHFVTMAEYGYPEWYSNNPYSYLEFFDEYGGQSIETLSRNASDYRKISDLSELNVITGDIPSYDEFMSELLSSEMVAYDCFGKTILLYNYSWFDSGYHMIMLYDFVDTSLSRDVHSDKSLDVFSYSDHVTWMATDSEGNTTENRIKYLKDYYLN